MTYHLKLWIDPSIITNEHIQLPEKIVVDQNADGSDKYNLTITRSDILASSTWAEQARFLLTPDPKIGHMPIKTDEGLKYLLVESDYVGYSNYWTYYAATKLWFNVLEDSYGKFIRFGSNTSVDEYWRTLSQTYRLDSQGNKVYYLFPKCGVDRGYGEYWHYPSGTYIRSMIERNFDTYQENPYVSYINDNNERISACPYTGVQEAISANTETEGGAVCITTRIHIEAGSSVVLFSVATFNTANVIDFTLNRSEKDKYTITVPFPRNASSVSGGTTREIPNFDPTIPHRYVFIHKPNKVLEVWVDNVQYKKEDGSDIYYRKSGIYDSYDKDTYIWGYNKYHNNWTPIEDLYEFRLYQGKLDYENTLELTASITASRNPVTINRPSLSTSELTCHVKGALDRNSDNYKQYIEILDSCIDCTGDYVKYINADGTEVISNVPTVNNEYFVVDSDMDTGVTIPNGKTHDSERFTEYNYNGSDVDYMCYLWEEDSQILSLGKDNPLVQIHYSPFTTEHDWQNPYSNCMKLIPTKDNKFVLKCNKFTSQEFDGFYKKHNYKIYFLQASIELGYCIFDIYIDNIKAIFTTEEGETYPYIRIRRNAAEWGALSGLCRVTMNNFITSLVHPNEGWVPNPTRFYSRKVYKLVKNTNQEEYPELTYLWNTGETTEQITVQPTEPTTYTCTVTQGSRTASASILIDTMLKYTKPVAVISPQSKPYVEHMLGKFYGTNSYDTNEPEGEIIKYIWNGVETASPVLTTRVTKTDIITLQVVNIYGEISDEVQVDLSQGGFDQWGYSYKFLDFPVFLVCSKGASLYDTLMSRFPIPTSTKDLYTTRYDTEYPKYTRIGFTTDISNDTITYMGCFPHYGVAEYTAPRDELDIYPLGVSWLEKRKILKYFDKVKGSKGSLLTCIGHPEIKEEGYGNLEFVLNALGIITPKDRYTIPRLLDLLELFLIDYENGGLIEL